MALTPAELDSPEQIRQRAITLESTLNSVSEKSSSIRTTWSALSTSYSAPEADTVHNAMNKPDDWARTLKGHAKTMRASLVSYADKLDELKVVRDQLVKDIAAHEAAVAEADAKKTTVETKGPNLPGSHNGPGGTVSNATVKYGGVTPELVDEANELTTRVEQFQTDLEDAQRECGNKLNATWGGPQFVQVDKTSVNNPYAWGTSMDAKRDQTRTGKEAWGSPDAWKLARKNNQAYGLLLRQGAWKSIVDGWHDFKDLMGWGGDPGATDYKRSGLAKVAVDLSAFTILSSPLGTGLMSYDKNARQRYAESCETVKATLKGIVSYDTWSADPIGTYGGFVPDMVTTAASMGSGGAAKLSVKALSMVSPGKALKVARVLHVLRQVDTGVVDDVRRTLKVAHSSPDMRKLETATGVLPHARVDGSGVTPTYPHIGPGPIESGAGGHHPDTGSVGHPAADADATPRSSHNPDAGGGNQPKTGTDPMHTPEARASGSGATPANGMEPRRAAPDTPAPESRNPGQPSASPTRSAEQPDMPGGQVESPNSSGHPTPGNDTPFDHVDTSAHSGPRNETSVNPAEPNTTSHGGTPGTSNADVNVRPPDGKNVTPGSKGRPYDPDAQVRETVPATEAPRSYTPR